ncbi:MAG: zinc ribbon domain-containing protein [Desulfarculus sp.]|nr:zinc ribbon domain-containing protein [Desulfarculus sp.]
MQPKTVELEDAKRPCPACGLNTCQRQRQDYYLSLFFIPLFPVKRGEPYWQCARCGQGCQGQVQTYAQTPQQSPATPQGPGPSRPGPAACRFCGGELKQDFKYCPYCGAKIIDNR